MSENVARPPRAWASPGRSSSETSLFVSKKASPSSIFPLMLTKKHLLFEYTIINQRKRRLHKQPHDINYQVFFILPLLLYESDPSTKTMTSITGGGVSAHSQVPATVIESNFAFVVTLTRAWILILKISHFTHSIITLSVSYSPSETTSGDWTQIFGILTI